MSRAARTQGAVMTTILNTMTSKESDYRTAIATNHANVMSMADQLVINGTVESDLMSMVNNGDNNEEENLLPEEDIQSFLLEQRERLKGIAEKNVDRTRQIDHFIGAINALKSKVANDTTGELNEAGTEYESIIAELMKEEADRDNQMDPKESETYKDLCEKLGEKVKRGNDDDDIEVIRNDNGTEVANYKCPITATLMEDPVKSTLCGHIFSKVGIESMFKNGTCKCPVYGCNNAKITASDLNDDPYTATAVKRQKRKAAQEAEQMALSQAAVDLDGDDDGEE